MCKTKSLPPHLNALLCVKKFLFGEYLGTWSSGMIPVLGTGGLGFDSRSTPLKNLYFKILDFIHSFI